MMEAFRYGLSIPYIQDRASEMSRKLLYIPMINKRKEGPILCHPRAKRYRFSRNKKFPLPLPRTVLVVLKVHSPVFSIELNNKFGILEHNR